MHGLKRPPKRAKRVVKRNPQHNHPTLQPKLPPHPEILVLHQQLPNPQHYLSPPLQFLHHLFLNRHLHNNHHFLAIFFQPPNPTLSQPQPHAPLNPVPFAPQPIALIYHINNKEFWCSTVGGGGGGVNGVCRAVPRIGGGGRKWPVPHRAVVYVPNKGGPIMELNKD